MSVVDPWFDELSDGVVLVESGLVRSLNGAAARLLSVDGAASIGRPAISVLRDHRLEALASGEATTSRLELDVRGRTLLAVGVTGGLVLSDLSELRRAQSEARELLAVLSHELRTPVAAVRSALEALRSESVPSDLRQRFLDGALAESERLTRLLSDLTVEVKPPRERSVDVEHALRRAVALVAPTARRREVEFALEVMPAEVWVDEDKLVQAAVNLLENAAVHGPESAIVDVVVWTEDSDACVEVRDVGAALSPEVMAELFEVRSLGSVKAKGTGLGLYIVRSLARDWGGAAWGTNRRDGTAGNAFGVKVPLSSSRHARTQRLNSSSGNTSGERLR